jgi:hypothetical protein
MREGMEEPERPSTPSLFSHDTFIIRNLEDLEAGLHRPHLDYHQRPGTLRMCLASMRMDHISADPSTWQPAVIGVSHLHEVSTHFSFESEPIRDFLGFGAGLQVRDATGVKHSLQGDFFLRFVPRPFLHIADTAYVSFPHEDTIVNSFNQIFGSAPPIVAVTAVVEEKSIEPGEPTSIDIIPPPPFGVPDLEDSGALRRVHPNQFNDLNNEHKSSPIPNDYMVPMDLETPPSNQASEYHDGQPPSLSASTTSSSSNGSSLDLSIKTRPLSPLSFSLDESFVQVKIEEVMDMAPSEFEAFMRGLPPIIFSQDDGPLKVVDDGVVDLSAAIIDIPDNAALGGDDFIKIATSSTPLTSELLRTPLPPTDQIPSATPIRTDFPIERLLVKRDEFSGMMSLRKEPPVVEEESIDKPKEEENSNVSLYRAVSAIISLEPAQFYEPAMSPLPFQKDEVDESMTDSVPDLINQEHEELPVYLPTSPPYVPQSPPPPLDPNAPVYVPRSPSVEKPPVSEALTTLVEQVKERVVSLENQAAVSSAHLCDISGHVEFVHGMLVETRGTQTGLHHDFQRHATFVDEAIRGTQVCTDQIKEDVEASRKQIGELAWLYERADRSDEHGKGIDKRINNIFSHLDQIRNKRSKVDTQFVAFKKETKVKLETLQAENSRTARVLATQGEHDAQVLRDIEDIRNIQVADRHHWAQEINSIKRNIPANLNERMASLENIFSQIVHVNQNNQMFISPPVVDHEPIHHSMPPISANTVHQVLSALMSTSNRTVQCSA